MKQHLFQDITEDGFRASQKDRMSKASKPVCGKVMEKEIGFKCLDCFKDNKALICEQCFDQSDHFGHRVFYQNQKQGLCDCGEYEHLYPNAKVGCSQHKGRREKRAEITMDKAFQKHLSYCLNEWFLRVFASCEAYLLKKEITKKEYHTKLLNCILDIIKDLNLCDDEIIECLASILQQSHAHLKQKKEQVQEYSYCYFHDCEDYKHVMPSWNIYDDEARQLTKKSCSCSILELIFRFSMSCFSSEENQLKDILLQIMAVESFKESFTVLYTRYFTFLYSIPINQNICSQYVLLQTRNEVFSSEILCSFAYESGQISQIFNMFLEVTRFFKENKSEGEEIQKIAPLQHFVHCDYIIRKLLTKPKLLGYFLADTSLFPILLQAAGNLNSIIDYQHSLQHHTYPPCQENTYRLYYTLTGEKNLFKVIACFLAQQAGKKGQIKQQSEEDLQKKTGKQSRQYLISFILQVKAALDNLDAVKAAKVTSYTMLERIFCYFLFALFEFNISTVRAEKLPELLVELNLSNGEFKALLMRILRRTLMPISLFLESKRKMWVYSGEEFVNQICSYVMPNFELRAIDSLLCKLITLLYPVENLFQLMPQNQWSRYLLEGCLEQKLNNVPSEDIQAASNMVPKAILSLSEYLSFMCYNITTDIDVAYVLCLYYAQTIQEIPKDELAFSNQYLATLLNALNTEKLSSQKIDCKELDSLYNKDIGKKAPPIDMLSQVGQLEGSSVVKIFPQFEGKYEPYSFTFNNEANNKYFAVLEGVKETSKRVNMALGNFALNETHKIIARNTISSQTFESLKGFLRSEYNRSELAKDKKLQENLLFPMLKLALIYVEANDMSKESMAIVREFLVCLREEIKVESLGIFMSAVEEKVKERDREEDKRIAGAEGNQEIKQETNNNNNMEEKQKMAMQRKAQMMEQIRLQQEKFKARLQIQEPIVQEPQEPADQEENCSFCKEKLSSSPYGILVLVQANNFFADATERLLKNNLQVAQLLLAFLLKNLIMNLQGIPSADRILQQWKIEKENAEEMTLMTSCDHKMHVKCLKKELGFKQPTPYEAVTSEYELKCLICNQYMNLFIEIQHEQQFQSECQGRIELEENEEKVSWNYNSIYSSGQNDSNASSYGNFQGQSSYQGYFSGIEEDQQYGQVAGNYGSAQYGQNGQDARDNKDNNEGDDDDDIDFHEVIYKKVNLGQDKVRVSKAQSLVFEKIERLERKKLYKKVKVAEVLANLNQQMSQTEEAYRRMLQRGYKGKEFEMAQDQLKNMKIDQPILMKYHQDIKQQIGQQQMQKLNKLKTATKDQFVFLEQSILSILKYLDLSPKRPDSYNKMVRVGRVLVGSCRNAFAVIDSEQERTDIVNLRAEFAKKFIELFLKDNHENESVDRNEQKTDLKVLMPTKTHQKHPISKSSNDYGNTLAFCGNLYGAADSNLHTEDAFYFSSAFNTNNNNQQQYPFEMHSQDQQHRSSTPTRSNVKNSNANNSSNNNSLLGLFGKTAMESRITESYLQFLLFELLFECETSGKFLKAIQITLNQVIASLLQQVQAQHAFFQRERAKSDAQQSQPQEDSQLASKEAMFRASSSILWRVITLYAMSIPSNQPSPLDSLLQFQNNSASSTNDDQFFAAVLRIFEIPDAQSIFPSEQQLSQISQTYQSQGYNIDNKVALTLALVPSISQLEFSLINLPANYLEYSKSIYKKKCCLCGHIPLVNDLFQCLLCGEICCSRSCTGQTKASLNTHTDIKHGGQSLFIDTQSGFVLAIANSHNSLLISGSLYTNSLKQAFSKITQAPWSSFSLNQNYFQQLKKAAYELNVRNLISEDHLKRSNERFTIVQHEFF